MVQGYETRKLRLIVGEFTTSGRHHGMARVPLKPGV